jgi:Domain of Unknown Function (DUF1080)
MKRLLTQMLLVGFVALGGISGFPVLAEDSADLTFLDPAKAGRDYEIQGEYAGVLAGDNGHKWGAQIIALGGGKFRAVGYPGGLPGDGFSSQAGKRSVEGKMAGDVATFKGDVFRLTADGEKITVVADDGTPVGTMAKLNRKSPTLGAAPPAGAIVLFDGKSADGFEDGEITEGNLLLAGCVAKTPMGDGLLHAEFRTPFKPFAREQARGNSGVYLQSRYEVQVLDSFGLEGEENECGGIYSLAKPKYNMCFPPLSWQTYDIDFTSARYDANGKKTANARATIKLNGVVIHDDLEFPTGTPGKDEEGPEPLGVYLQGHGNPVVYRNIWFLPNGSK